MTRLPWCALVYWCLCLSATAASAQTPTIDGPAAPVVPAVVNRDSAGRATVRAIRLERPLTVDGKLDEGVYQTVASVSDFIQQVPREGAAATERTESWVLFDKDTLYVSARCWDTAPPEKWVANELRRDTNQLRQNDTFGVILDTFYDRRNGYLFLHEPARARADQASPTKATRIPIGTRYGVRTQPLRRRVDGGDGDPFKSLRYNSGANQVWGINIRRVIRRKNEWTHLTPIPAAAGVPGGCFVSSRARYPSASTFPKPARTWNSAWHRAVDDGSNRAPQITTMAPATSEWARVRRHGEPHGGPHGEHRLRAGRESMTRR